MQMVGFQEFWNFFFVTAKNTYDLSHFAHFYAKVVVFSKSTSTHRPEGLSTG
jgi:hypothetical protein